MSKASFVEISSFCQTGSGTTPSRSQSDRYYGGDIPWVKSGELKEAEIENTEERVTKAALKETSLRLLPVNTLLVAMYGATVGRVGILKTPATTNQAVCHIIPDPKRADARYMFHALRQLSHYFVSRGVGGAQPNINQGIVQRAKVFLPDLQEQRRIALIFDRVDKLRLGRGQVIGLLKDLPKAIFRSSFAAIEVQFPVHSLEELVSETKLGLVRSASEFGEDFEFPYIRMDAISRDGYFDIGKVLRTGATDKEVRDYRVERGDLLFNTRNSRDLVGKTTVFPGGANTLFNNNIMRMRFDSKVLPEYVAAAFQSPAVRSDLETRKSGTTSVCAIYWKDLKSLKIPVPPLELQAEYVNRVKLIDEMLVSHMAQSSSINDLASCLQEILSSGQLDGKDSVERQMRMAG